MVAEVIVNSTVKNLNKTFDYHVPVELTGTIKLGDRVLRSEEHTSELQSHGTDV